MWIMFGACEPPLCSAVMASLSKVVETLVQDARCKITQSNSIGNSALHVALLHGQHDITMILARCEGFRFLKNLAGHAPLHIVATLGNCHSLSLLYPTPIRTEETLRELQLTKKQNSSSTPGPISTSVGLKRELNQRVKYTGDTALHLAVREKHDKMTQCLMALGAAVDLQNNRGQTALLLACAADNTELVVHLLKKGAPPSTAGYMPLQHRSVLGVHSRESSLTPLHIAVSIGNMQMVAALCEFGADINSCDELGRSVLHVALLSGAGDIALYILNRSPDVLDKGLGLGGQFLLHEVCRCTKHAAEITTRLLEHGCSLHQSSHHGNQALHEALCWENLDVVRVLLEHGADPNVPGELNALPLAIAARTGHIQMAKLLLAAGADINGAHSKGDSNFRYEAEEWEEEEGKASPLREALEAEMRDFAVFLVNAGCDVSKEEYLFNSTDVADLHTSPAIHHQDLDESDDDDSDDDDDDDNIPYIVRNDKELFELLKDKVCNTQSLEQLSLEAVRQVFRHGDPPFALMLGLPLPEKMIGKLFYKDSL
ncbi:transient receptor potential cation channel subfamily A member 1-like isoform X2 [Babylonia areolata]|uniref:transient receptor potential cation channel subfamily A member 1-like isoform X2 n=1 Tax=Babylonia areolata TaxID=304850 RepID=UPI003FD661A1